jgi:hypothetical protein
MSLDTLLGFPEGYLSQLANTLDPPPARDELDPARDRAASRSAPRETPSSTPRDAKNTVGDAKNPRGFGKVKS